jgi:hypothetical protein
MSIIQTGIYNLNNNNNNNNNNNDTNNNNNNDVNMNNYYDNEANDGNNTININNNIIIKSAECVIHNEFSTHHGSLFMCSTQSSTG